MVKLKKVEPGVRMGLPLKKSGWGYIDPEEHGILATFDDHGIFISEAELNVVGYVRDESSDEDSIKITKGDGDQLYYLTSLLVVHAETMVAKAKNMELGLDAKAKMAYWRAVQDGTTSWRERFKTIMSLED